MATRPTFGANKLAPRINPIANANPVPLKAKTIKAKKEDPKGECSICGKEYKEKTLATRDGICYHCERKAIKVANGTPDIDPKAKQDCLGPCGKPYLLKTLKNNDGYCARCAKGTSPTKKELEVKVLCKGTCGHSYLPKTLDVKGGYCGHCINKQKRAISPKKTVAQDRVMCAGTCGNIYIKRTLNKYGGICGRCYNNKMYPKQTIQIEENM